MRKRLLLPLITVLFTPFLIRAEWIPLNKLNTSPEPPNVTLVSDDGNSTVLKIEISGFDLKQFTAQGKQFQRVDLMSESFTTEVGNPELPYVAKVLAIPDQAGISLEILETIDLQTFNNISLPPARESWIEGSPETPYLENPHGYQSQLVFPSELARLDEPSVFRDFRITRVSVFPVRYIAAKKELQIVTSIMVKINYGKGEAVNPKSGPKKPIAPSFGDLYRSFIFNYQSVLDKSYGGKEEGHELMLCIMPDDFYTSFQPYAEWKRLSGIDIHITKFSDIGANATNPDIIKNHIADAYHNWEVPPSYVLLVGDDGVFPKQICSYGFPNEDFFVEIDGNDFFPELFIGRFTNQSDYGMQVMINKFLKYEKTPYTANTDWFKKGICCSNNYYESQVETKRFAAERMIVDGGFTSVDTMMSDSPCTYDVADVVSAINNGRSWLNYRGEGWSSGWWATCTPLNVSDLPSINNGQKFTFVTSIGCGVAMFQTSGNCFGEEWLEMGTLSNPKGAAAFIGPTGNTHTTYNNKIDKGIYIGMFQEGMETPGQALVRGKLYMYNVFGNEYYVDYHYKIFCILGDPSIHIWKDIPQEVTVNYPSSIPYGNNTVDFLVNHAATGLPVTNARVCVTGEDIFSTGYTDESGNAFLDIEAETLGSLNVTVTGGNVIPFQGILYVVQPTGPFVVKESYTINDALGGNGNGLMDYGETNLLSLTMKNVGVQQADNITVTLITTDTNISIIDNFANYGSIAPGTTAVVTDGFAYTVENDIPDLHSVSLEVIATNGSDTWLSYITIEAHSPKIEYVDFVLTDPAGNNNGKFDPGETVNLTISIKNSGTSEALNVMGEITEIDPYVSVNSPVMNYGNIAGGSVSNAVFSVSSLSNTPAGHLAEFSLNLIADLGINGNGMVEVVIGQIPILILDLDENGNSSPEMEAAINTIGISYEKLTEFPTDLHLYSTIFVFLGVFPQNHQLTTAEGQALANYLNIGGSLYMEGADTWCFDQSTPVHGMFNIIEGGDGGSDMGTVTGVNGTFTEGMSFSYSGDNSWMDRIDADPPAFKVLNNQSPLYGTAVAFDAGDYKTIGSSHEFGGLEDGTSPSTKEELMAAYLEFLGVSLSLQASFISNSTQVCENGTVNFFDQSSGNAISWAWTFEGGNPATSTLQNPTIFYSTPGTYDVSLTVSDGNEYSTLTLDNYITVITIPGIPPVPSGAAAVCADDQTTAYSTAGLTGITSYDWLLLPANSGFVVGSGLNVTVYWAEGYLGEAFLQVAAENACGTGEFSSPLSITRYLPEVVLEPFDWVCLGWPPFELTGGSPEGGEYSGPGVENGWFNPSNAGVGTHTINYTYMDANNCENTASETILVDPCTGISDAGSLTGINIFPNPSNGIINIHFTHDISLAEVSIANTMSTIVHSEVFKEITGKILSIDLSDLPHGIYFIKVKSDQAEMTAKIVIQ